MVDSWKQARFVHEERLRSLVNTTDQSSEILRQGSQALDLIADYAGPALEIIGRYSLGSPLTGLLNSVAGIIESLTEDLLNTGVYALIHHNLRDVIDAIGVYNLIDNGKQVLPPVASTLGGGSHEEMMRDSVEDQSILDIVVDDVSGSRYTEIRGLERWLSQLLQAFNDKSDSRRPIVDDSGSLGGVIFVAGAESIPDLAPVVDAYSRFFEFSEFADLAQGILNLESTNLEDTVRLKDAAVFSSVQTTVEGRAQRPDFLSLKVKDCFPGLGRIVVDLSALAEMLGGGDVVSDLASNVIRACEHRIRRLSEVFDKMARAVDDIGALTSNLPNVNALWLDVQAGGVPNLVSRINMADARPQFSPGSLIVGGGFFFTVPGVYNLLKELVFPESSSSFSSALASFTARAGLAGVFDEDFVLSPADWATWIAQPDRIEVPLAFESETQNITESGSRARGVSDGGDTDFVASADGHGTEIHRAPGASHHAGGAHQAGRSASGGLPGTEPGLGSRIGSLLVRRASWATCTREIERYVCGYDLRGGSAVMSGSGTRNYFVAHVAHDVPQLDSVDVVGENPVPSGLLLEAQRQNLFFSSDSFTELRTSGVSAVKTCIEDVSPVADVIRRRSQAGSAVSLAASGSARAVFASDLRATPDHAGTALTNIVDVTGAAFAISTLTTSHYALGVQTLNVCGRTGQRSLFCCRVEYVDVASSTVWLERAIFTQPVAEMLLVTGLKFVDGDFDSWFEQRHLEMSAAVPSPVLYSFSLFNRWVAPDIYTRRGVSMRFSADDVSPAYSAEYGLGLPRIQSFTHASGVFPVSGNTVEIDTPLTLPERGCFIELDTIGAGSFVLGVSEVVVNGAFCILHCRACDHVGDTVLYHDVGAVLGCHELDTRATYQMWERSVLEVPTLHRERTTHVPHAADPNSYLTLSHPLVSAPSALNTLEAYVVDAHVGYIPVAYDAGLAGISFRLGAVGSVRPGRACIEVSPDVKITYPGRILEIRYSQWTTEGCIRIYPFRAEQSALDPSGEILAWRGQWEPGAVSSSIPSEVGDVGLVEATTAMFRPGKYNTPSLNAAYVDLKVRMVSRCQTRAPGTQSFLLYVPGIYKTALIFDDEQASIELDVMGIVYVSSPFTYEADTALTFIVSYEYGATQVRFRTVGTVPELDELVAGPPVPAVDQELVPGVKMYLGSDDSGANSLQGRVIDVTIGDSP